MVIVHLENLKVGSKKGVTISAQDVEPMQTGSLSVITAFAVNQFHWKTNRI